MATNVRIPMVIAAVFAGSLAGRAGAEPFFTGLGHLAGGEQFSRAWAISADGTTVVGEGRSGSGTEAFRWTPGTGMRGLGDLAGGAFGSVAYGVSGDGSVIVGGGRSSASGEGREAFRWTASGGMAGLGDLSGGPFDSVAFGVSADGAVVVGVGSDFDAVAGTPIEAAFRWTSADGGTMTSINPTATFGGNGPANRSVAFGVSADGTVVAGRFSSSGPEGDARAGAWTEAGGWVPYPGGSVSGDANGQSRAVSADGDVVVGSTNAPPRASTHNAFRWDRTGSSAFLHGVSPDVTSTVRNTVGFGVSADGEIVVGTLVAAGLPMFLDQVAPVSAFSRAFVWDSGGGFRLLQDVLASQGVALSGWTLLEAHGISADGRAITGTGINPGGLFEAWYASFDDPVGGVGSPVVVPEPSTLAMGLSGLMGLALVLRLRRGGLAGRRRPDGGVPPRG